MDIKSIVSVYPNLSNQQLDDIEIYFNDNYEKIMRNPKPDSYEIPTLHKIIRSIAHIAKTTDLSDIFSGKPITQELVYQTLLGETGICHLGNKKIFRKMKYASCDLGRNCECYKNIYREKKNITNEEKEKINDKRKKTNIKKFNVDNPMKLESVVKKGQDSYKKKTGYSNPSKNPAVVQKRKNTNLEKYGVENYAQLHINSDMLVILNSKDEFHSTYLKFNNHRLFCDHLGIDRTTYRKYCEKYNLEYVTFKSSYELEIEDFLKSLNVKFTTQDRKLINPLELDFYLPDHKLAIEFNGLHWHSERFKEKTYHQNKHIACYDNDIRLVMINEDEWNIRKDVIKNKIKNLVGLSEKGPGARKLQIKKISNQDCKAFVNLYHIQGSTSNLIHSYGAFHDDKLVAVCCFGKQRSTGDHELTRFCTDGKIYAGIFSKLFKFYLKDQTPNEVVTFADLRYSDGGLYEKTGFVKEYNIGPTYQYITPRGTEHKQNYTKSKIKEKFPEVYSSDKTEHQMMIEVGYLRIYDCGKIKYKWTNI